jgi:hypothetical protein
MLSVVRWISLCWVSLCWVSLLLSYMVPVVVRFGPSIVRIWVNWSTSCWFMRALSCVDTMCYKIHSKLLSFCKRKKYYEWTKTHQLTVKHVAAFKTLIFGSHISCLQKILNDNFLTFLSKNYFKSLKNILSGF